MIYIKRLLCCSGSGPVYLAVVELAQLFNDPLLQYESLPQLFSVVLHRHFALFLLHRVIALHRSGAGAAHAGLKEHPARGRRQLRGGLGAGGGHDGGDDDGGGGGVWGVYAGTQFLTPAI